MIVEAKRMQVRKAVQNDLIALPNPGAVHPWYYVEKKRAQEVIYSILDRDVIHLSGGTGSGKTEGIEVIVKNWAVVCRCLGIRESRSKCYLFPIILSNLQGPDELYRRRSINEQGTYDEIQPALETYKKAIELSQEKNQRVIIWFPEIGRTLPSIQNGIIAFIQEKIRDDHGNILGNGSKITVIADSNYQAQDDHGNYVGLTPMDGALSGRFTSNIHWDYYSSRQEFDILCQVMGASNSETEFIVKVLLDFAHKVRKKKLAGELASLPFPNFRHYFSFIRKVENKRFELDQIFKLVFYGTANYEDQKSAGVLLNMTLHRGEEKYYFRNSIA